MTIPIPTIDDFDTSTVMTTIREVVDYLIGMVPQINNGDITDLQTSYTNNVLTITLVKGDGTTISKNVTIQGGSGTESPYPTDVTLSLSGTVLNCDIMLSDNTHVTGSQDLTTFATYTEVQSIQSDLQEQITGLKLSTDNNNMTLNGDSVQIVKSVSGTVSDGNLKIIVNGVQSGDIPLPDGFIDNNTANTTSFAVTYAGSGAYGSIINVSNYKIQSGLYVNKIHYTGNCPVPTAVGSTKNGYLHRMSQMSTVRDNLESIFGFSKLDDGEYTLIYMTGSEPNNLYAYISFMRITISNGEITNNIENVICGEIIDNASMRFTILAIL